VGAKPTASQAAAMAPRQKFPDPHPRILTFLGFNRGDFKPNRPLRALPSCASNGSCDQLRDQHRDLKNLVEAKY
jgi:hypothetical protein